MACLNTPASDGDRSELRHRYLRRNQCCTSLNQLATAHPFNDEHGTAANGTAQLGGDLGIRCTVVCTKQSTAAHEHIATPAVGEKAEVADADQALGQNMDQEAAQELI